MNLVTKWKTRREVERSLRAARKAVGSEDHARSISLGIDVSFRSILWEEPNRAGTPPLHIGDSGERYSTLTGVWWIDDDRFVVNHRSGLRLALFDLTSRQERIAISDIPHLTDDIAVKPLENGRFEIAVSGCWACVYSLFHMEFSSHGLPSFEFVETLDHRSEDFCHGVAYDQDGQLCTTLHTGRDPRIHIGKLEYRLPRPWGVRDICFDSNRSRYLAVAVNEDPRRGVAYSGVMTSVWELEPGKPEWSILTAIDHVHSDALDTHDGEIWLPDQLGDRVIALDGRNGRMTRIVTGEGLDFPHGLSISSAGRIAVSNYGSSSITVFTP